MAKRKDRLMKEYLSQPTRVDDSIIVPRKYVSSRTDLPVGATEIVKIVAINDDGTYTVRTREYYKDVNVPISETKPYTSHIGINPFPNLPWMQKIERVAYSLDSILHNCGITVPGDYPRQEYAIDGVTIPELNWNPYVIKGGEKHYYQRELCWELQDERSFIDSIYNSIQCGTIILRSHSWADVEKQIKSGNTEVAFNDIVDGKQRMNTLHRFINDKFTDNQGNYWSDLSEYAQRVFLGSQCLGFARLREDATDEDVLQSFLSVNFTGKPMSKQHITYVQKIAELFRK